MTIPAIKTQVATTADERVPSQHNSKGIRLDPTTLLSACDRRVDFKRLQTLEGTSIVDAGQFDRRTVVELCKFAALLEVTEIASAHPLDGKLVVTAFFEPSTRTRLSFESAVQRLDGKIVSVPDGKVTGIAKGESLADIGEMLNTYGDLVVLRHPHTNAVDDLRRNLELPLINAGNGTGEHPTQALLDWYTLIKWRPELIRGRGAKLSLGIIGTPGSMRAVKSFLRMSMLFSDSIERITVVSQAADPLGGELRETLRDAPTPIEVTSDVRGTLPEFDVVYMNSIAFLGDGYREMDSTYRLSADSPLKEGAVIMHPFARAGELCESLDRTPHNLYFAQAASAVFMRQALLISVLGRISHLPPSLLLLTTE